MEVVKNFPYSPPEMEIVLLDSKDVLTTSTGLESDGNIDYGW